MKLSYKLLVLMLLVAGVNVHAASNGPAPQNSGSAVAIGGITDPSLPMGSSHTLPCGLVVTGSGNAHEDQLTVGDGSSVARNYVRGTTAK